MDPPKVDGKPEVSAAREDGQWSAGGTVEVTLAFTEAVDVDTSRGPPAVEVVLGGTQTRTADYVSGTGTSTLVFGYTLLDGAATLASVTPNSLAVSRGSIRNQATQADALLAHVGVLVRCDSACSAGAQATYEDAPERHDGETTFLVGLRFGGEPSGLNPMHDASSVLVVTGGRVTKAGQTATDAKQITGLATLVQVRRVCTQCRH